MKKTILKNIQKISFPRVEEWNNSEVARREKEALGFYLMSNPLKKYENDLKDFSNLGVNEEKQSNKEMRCGGIIQDVTVRYDKKNRKWAIINLNLLIGSCEVYVFYELYEKHSHQLVEDEKLFFVGKPSSYGDDKENNRMVATAIHSLQDIRKTLSKTVNIMLSFGMDNKNEMADLMARTAAAEATAAAALRKASIRPRVPRPRRRRRRWGIFSDMRLKTNIVQIGLSDTNIPIYNYNYRNFMDKVDGIDIRKTYRGVIAQDLIELGLNDAVKEIDGIYSVDYNKIDVKFEIL